MRIASPSLVEHQLHVKKSEEFRARTRYVVKCFWEGED